MDLLIFVILTALAILSVLWPVLRRSRAAGQLDSDIAFFEAQAAELERDLQRGLISEADAHQARASAARRLMALSQQVRNDQTSPASASQSLMQVRWFALLAVLAVPIISVGLYARIGQPDFPDMPLQARLEAAPGRGDMMAVLAQLEKHLAENPQDGRGQELIAPVYMRMGRYGDAAKAWRAVINTNGPSLQRWLDLGQALIYANNGDVTAEAREVFEAANRLSSERPEPLFFLGLAAEQSGEFAKAREYWTLLLANAPPDLETTKMVRARLEALPPADSTQAQAIANLPAQERQTAIRSMVDGLAARLQADGHDLEGWLRLLRAYSVLQEKDKAQSALGDARRNFTSDAQALSQIENLARELGLGG
jgi:cytochrome c-type biogenesis protein CcmH